VITRLVDGQVCEPVEELVVATTEEYVGAVTGLIGGRLARMTDLVHDGKGGVRIEYVIPTRGLIGLRQAFLTATRGNGTLASQLRGYEPWLGELGSDRNGALVAAESGVATTYGLANAEERGILFIEPGTPVYAGQIVGLHAREQDLVVNVCKERKLTNVRSSTAEVAVRLTPATKLSLEQSLDFIAADELVEVTPAAVRLRKRLLDAEARAKVRKAALAVR
jgi:GTP-binding protein